MSSPFFLSDTPHYENVLPKGWCLSTLGEVFTLQAGKNITAKDIKDAVTESHPYKCYGGNGVRGFVALYNREGDFPIIGRQGALCGNINIAKGKFYATEHAVVVESYCDVDLMWAYYILITLNLNQYATATAQPGLSVAVINDVCIPIPPRKEQERISKEIEHWFALIDQIEQGKSDLQTIIKQTKNKILDFAIHGKLVPQDPNDEPAIELLKRINPDFTPCDNGHYTQLPEGWAICKMKQITSITNGKSQKNVETLNGIYPIYGSGGVIGRANQYLCIAGSTIIGRKGTINNPIFVEEHFWNVDTAFGLKANDAILDQYLYYFCLSFDFSKLDKSTAMPSLTKTSIGNVLIPIPPYKEQERIVAKIDMVLDTMNEILRAV